MICSTAASPDTLLLPVPTVGTIARFEMVYTGDVSGPDTTPVALFRVREAGRASDVLDHSYLAWACARVWVWA